MMPPVTDLRPMRPRINRKAMQDVYKRQVLEQMVTVKSSLKESQMEELDAMADAIVNSMK